MQIATMAASFIVGALAGIATMCLLQARNVKYWQDACKDMIDRNHDLEDENSALKHRCRALTHGCMCFYCLLDCEERSIPFGDDVQEKKP